MMCDRQIILESLHRQLGQSQHIIGVSCGSGLSAKHAKRGGADLILALNSGRLRQMGQGSLAGFMPFINSNKLVMEFGSKELVPKAQDIPIIFGFCATDPTIMIEQYIRQIQTAGFAGINNYPSVGLIDGKFREALEEQGMCFDLEVKAIRLAHEMGLFTLAFVFSPEQAGKMCAVGADVICAHFGLTKGGLLGAKKVLSLEVAAQLARDIFAVCDGLRTNIIKLVYGGPVSTPTDVEYIYNSTSAQGYLGGSTFDRVPSEETIANRTREFKDAGRFEQDKLLQKMLSGLEKHYDYISFVKEYVAANYMNEIAFSDLAAVAHISRSHLSNLFRKEMGCTFPDYLTRFRIHKACEIIRHEHLSNSTVAELVGYNDYAHFSKTFKKVTGYSPTQYARQKKHI